MNVLNQVGFSHRYFMMVPAILFLSSFTNSAAAQPKGLVLPEVDPQEFIDLSGSGEGHAQLAGHLWPVDRISVCGASNQDTIVSYSTSDYHSEWPAYSAGASLTVNVPRSTDLGCGAEMQRMALMTSRQVTADRPLQGRDDAVSEFSTQNAVLAALYNATLGDSWNNNTNWDPRASPTTEELSAWYGVTVHLGRLTELQLDANNLRGMLPPEIGGLKDLQVLWIDGNALYGGLPKELGQLVQLRTLLVSHNQVSGSIPNQLTSLEELEILWLHDNELSGTIPQSLGSLTMLRSLVLSQNMLSGRIPAELGRLAQLETLWLNNNALSGEVPSSIGDLKELQQLVLDHNDLSGRLPRSLLALQKLAYLSFDGQSLCAPSDGEFQTWLSSIPVVKGPTCVEELKWIGRIDDLGFTVNQAIAPIAFPAAAGGTPPYVYALNPALPTGLMFDSVSRFLTGTPSVVTDPTGYTYTASDSAGAQVSQTFSIEVVRSLSNEEESASVQTFTLQSNYPNPFHETTYLVMDLPMPAMVTVEVMDLIGRHILTVPPTPMPSGKRQIIPITGSSLTSGVYIYRVRFSSQESTQVQYGRLLRIQ